MTELEKHLNESFIDSWNSVISKTISENETPNKIINIVENNLDFNKQQKGRGRPLDLPRYLKILGFIKTKDHRPTNYRPTKP